MMHSIISYSQSGRAFQFLLERTAYQLPRCALSAAWATSSQLLYTRFSTRQNAAQDLQGGPPCPSQRRWGRACDREHIATARSQHIRPHSSFASSIHAEATAGCGSVHVKDQDVSEKQWAQLLDLIGSMVATKNRPNAAGGWRDAFEHMPTHLQVRQIKFAQQSCMVRVHAQNLFPQCLRAAIPCTLVVWGWHWQDVNGPSTLRVICMGYHSAWPHMTFVCKFSVGHLLGMIQFTPALIEAGSACAWPHGR